MYGMSGLKINVENIFKLAAPYIDNESVLTMSDLKPSYIRFLQKAHESFPIINDSKIVVSEAKRAKALSSAFSESTLDDLHQERMVGSLYSDTLFKENIKLVEAAISDLKAINTELFELFNLAVHSVVLCDSNKNAEGFRAHGGTTNRCIGLIWLNIRPDLSKQNILEMLIHELTHTLVFIDELNNEHFDYYKIAKKEYWAISSILKKQRPMDKVIHSILVSMELLHARRSYLPCKNENDLIHPDSSSLIKNINASIESVLTHPLLHEVCKPRAIELILSAKSQLKSIEKGFCYAESL